MQQFNTLGALLALGLREDLKGPRTRGSTTEVGLETLDPATPVVEFTPDDPALTVPGARYFRVEAPELGGRLGAVPMGDLDDVEIEMIRTRFTDGHGLEFYLDQSEESADLPSVDHATVIAGPDGQGGLCVWTWHPGDVTGTAMARGGVTGCPINLVGVKLHNG